MRSGRGSGRDHDQRSVEQKKRKRKKERSPMIPHTKRCSNCNLIFPVECFDADNTGACGRQSWCVECKDTDELTRACRFARFRRFLERKEPQSWTAWEAMPGGAWGEWNRRMDECGDRCEHCGAGFREWQRSGHNLDRKDNNDGTYHSPENTVFACNPCNMRRGRMRWYPWKKLIDAEVADHGRGRVPHGESSDQFKRFVPRRCSHLAVDEFQTLLVGVLV